MLTVVRKDRFSDGSFAQCSPALTVIANVIRDHLIADRRAGRSFDRYGLGPIRSS